MTPSHLGEFTPHDLIEKLQMQNMRLRKLVEAQQDLIASKHPPSVDMLERVLLRSIIERKETCRQAAEQISDLISDDGVRIYES